MPALPASSSFTGGSVTEGQFKTALTALRDYLSALLGADGTVATALATLGVPLNAVTNKTAAYTVVTSDRGKLITTSGAGGWTLSLPAAATAGAGFSVSLWNGSSGTITIDPSAAELVNGAATVEAIAGAGGVLVCTGTAWHWLPTGRPVTTSPTDTTSARLLKVGDFGLGGYGGNVADFNSVDGNLSFIRADSSALNRPAAPNSIGINLSRSGTLHGQLMMGLNNTTGLRGTLFTRIKTDATTWTAWAALYGQGNILGTVSQTSGVPTGAIIERGSNANGEYVRFADGTQICTRTLTGATGSGSTWTFPAAFAAAPVVTGNAVATVLSSVCIDAAPSTTAVTVSARDKADARRADVMHLTATGRWF